MKFNENIFLKVYYQENQDGSFIMQFEIHNFPIFFIKKMCLLIQCI